MILDASTAPDLLQKAVRRFTDAGSSAAAFAQSVGSLAFVAMDEDEVQGWCWGYRLPRPDGADMLYLHNLEVAAPYRRRGVGRELLRSFLHAGARLGATRMFLVTGETNTAARHLYESMGAGLATQGPTVNYWFVLP
ncbi:GNAT family N-acetyltransferase [Actinoplanes sp. TRM 88003]|uniref:GNAT family N-acetyltransferase n=1 Tax=Paractinoplanes aksuensis TaxID=2939490 RepID=A0ABT1DES0_9ACTN|nr:GNAT family N-acetyltransferase [Actinoplanes aksuensis]MCO8269313.1 GNAT family N-acetyltransferase [Actinoplanes aksuensis]